MRPSGRSAHAIAGALTVAAITLATSSASAETRFEFVGSTGWMHGSVYDVPVNLAELQLGLGAYVGIHDETGSVEILGTGSLKRGSTQYGRTMLGLDFLGFEAVYHYQWVRLGLGARLGSMQVARATSPNGSETEDGVAVEGYMLAGVEPFAIGGRPVFFEAQARAIHWLDSMPSFWLGAGIRFCGPGCAR